VDQQSKVDRNRFITIQCERRRGRAEKRQRRDACDAAAGGGGAGGGDGAGRPDGRGGAADEPLHGAGHVARRQPISDQRIRSVGRPLGNHLPLAAHQVTANHRGRNESVPP